MMAYNVRFTPIVVYEHCMTAIGPEHNLCKLNLGLMLNVCTRDLLTTLNETC